MLEPVSIKRLLSVVVSVGVIAFSPISSATLLGTAGDYNAFMFDSFSSHQSDTEGRVAAGGNVSLSNYSVGLKSDPATYSLVSGGDVTYQPGSISNGGIYASGNVNIGNHYIAGDVTAGGSVNYLPGGGTVTGTVTPGSADPSPVDFGQIYNDLSTLSDDLKVATGGGLYNSQYGKITLTSDSAYNVFNLGIDELKNAHTLAFEMAGLAVDEIFIINVAGTVNEIMNMGITGADGFESNILFNLYDTTSLNMGGVGMRGSILAVDADVNFNSAHMNGTLVANSTQGTGQLNWTPYTYDEEVIHVPEPGSLALLSLGLVPLLMRRQKKNKATLTA